MMTAWLVGLTVAVVILLLFSLMLGGLVGALSGQIRELTGQVAKLAERGEQFR